MAEGTSNQDFANAKPMDLAKSTIVQFDDNNINQLIYPERESGMFADLWSFLRFLASTYNFLTTWYFLGLIGFPSDAWLVLEILVELFLVCDFFIMFLLKS